MTSIPTTQHQQSSRGNEQQDVVADSFMNIVGAWTKAGISSCVYIKIPSCKVDLLLDCGICEPQTLSAQFVFISHGHMDHAGACISHARAKALSSAPSTYYIPSAIKDAFLMAKQGFEAMDGHEIPMKIVEVNPNDEITLSASLKVRVFATEHRVPSQGFAFFQTKRGTLLPEYQGIPGPELGKLKAKGVEILTPAIEKLELVYTGDTTFEGLLNSPFHDIIFQAPILITELTYLNGERTNAGKYKHIHIEDIREHEDNFHNHQVIFVHISQKYSISQAIELLNSQLSREFLSKVKVSLHSFGANQVLTDPLDNRWVPRKRMPGWGWSNAGHQQSSYRNEHVVHPNARNVNHSYYNSHQFDQVPPEPRSGGSWRGGHTVRENDCSGGRGRRGRGNNNRK